MISCACKGQDQQRNNGLCHHFYLEESCFSSLHPKVTQLSSSPYVPGAFELLSQHWSSERVCSVSLCTGPLRRMNAWDYSNPSKSHFHSGTIPDGFHRQKLWNLLLLTLKPWAEAADMGLGPLALQDKPPQLRYPSQLIACSASSILLPVLKCLLLYIFSYWTFFSSRFQAFLNDDCSLV